MSEMTYGRLDRILRRIGFTVQVLDNQWRVYRHAETGAQVSLPLLPA